MANGEAGRPTKCTPERTAAICKAIEEGSPNVYAAIENDIDPVTFHRWMKQGVDANHEPYATFRKSVMRAKAKRVREQVRDLTADDPHPVRSRNLQFLLERQAPEHFGKSARMELQHGGTVNVESAAIAEAVRAALSGESDEALGLDD